MEPTPDGHEESAAALFLDRDFRLERHSAAAAALFGLTADDAGQALPEILRRAGQEDLLARRLSDAPAGREVHIGARWYRVAFEPRPETAGGVVVTFSDVTRRRLLEEALALEHDAARAYLDAADVLVVVLGEAGRVAFVNKKGCALLGRPEQEVLGLDWVGTFVPARERDATRAVLEALWRGDEAAARTHENRVVAKGEEERRIVWSNAVLRDLAGAVRAVVGTGLDVTDQREAEAALRRSEAAKRGAAELVEALYRDAPVGIVVVDRELRLVRMNRRLAEINGEPTEEAPGRAVHALLPDVADAVVPLIERVFETGEPILQAELRGRTPASAAERTWLVSCSPVHGEDGAVTFVQSVFLDVTERRALEVAVLAPRKRSGATSGGSSTTVSAAT